MDIKTVADGAGAVALIISIANTAWAFLTRDTKAAIASLGKVKTKVIDHDRRIQHVEQELKHLPSKDEVHELKLEIADLKGTIGRIETDVSGVSRTVHRIDEYLRKPS